MRTAKLGLDLRPHIAEGLISLRTIDPAELSPGEFTSLVRNDDEAHGARCFILDSLSGYITAMPDEKQLLLQLHELLSYLNRRGVVTFLVNPLAGLIGPLQSEIATSYVADAVLLLRFFEADGRIRKAISCLKNRAGAHENAIRELRIFDCAVAAIGCTATTPPNSMSKSRRFTRRPHPSRVATLFYCPRPAALKQAPRRAAWRQTVNNRFFKACASKVGPVGNIAFAPYIAVRRHDPV